MHQLGDRVLDLEAGVHLQEAEPLGGRVVEELDGAGAEVADRLGRPAGGVVQRGADLLAQAGCRRLLDHLLVPALERAVALAVDARCRRPAPRRAGRARRTARRRRCRRRTPTAASACAAAISPVQVGERADDPHAAAAAAGGRLDEQRQVGLGRRLRAPRRTGTPAVRHDPLGLDLRAHRVDRLRRRADPGQPGVDDRAGEVGVLGQEAVAGVDRVGAGAVRGGVSTAGRRRGRSRPGVLPGSRTATSASRTYGSPASASEWTATVSMPSVAAGAEHPRRDLGPVGDQQSADHGGRDLEVTRDSP